VYTHQKSRRNCVSFFSCRFLFEQRAFIGKNMTAAMNGQQKYSCNNAAEEQEKETGRERL
jgi:hypothetical protein